MILEGLTFDDVLLIPQHSTIESRSKIDVSITIEGLTFLHPVIPANMKTITGAEMAWQIIDSGGLAILHRFMPIEEQLAIAEDITDSGNDLISKWRFSVSIGVKEEDKDHVKKFWNIGVNIFCIDIAHGDSRQCLDMILWMKKEYPNSFLIAGNVATGPAAQRLWEAGADIVKVGIGPGSLCSTRIETGNGVPQLTALMDVAKTQASLRQLEKVKPIKKQKTFPFISDGGIKSAGDVVKALCFADMVMVGNVFAGCTETPGQIMSIDGRTFKEYVGSSTYKTTHIEGVAAIVPTKGRFKNILTKLLEGLRSGCSYQGASNLEDLKDNPVFIKITSAGLKESHPHDIILK